MSGNIFNFKVDLKLKPTAVTPTIVQYDEAQINFQIFDNGKVFNLDNYVRVEVTHKKPNGDVVIGVGEIALNDKGFKIVRYDYQGSEMSQLGFVESSIAIFDADENKISIRSFKILVVDDLRNGIAATAEFGVLQDLTLQIDTALALVEDKGDIALAKADYAEEKGDYAAAQGLYAIETTDQAVIEVNVRADAAIDYVNAIADSNKTRFLSPPLDTFTQIATTYPTPLHGDTIQVKGENAIYRFETGLGWKKKTVYDATVTDYLSVQLANMDAQKASKTELANVLDGTPKGTYATLAALQVAYPTGTTGVYIVTADGHIYSWSGSAWADRGLYQAVGIANESVTLLKLSKDVSGLNNYSTVPTFVNGVLTKVEELEGAVVKKRTTLTYNSDGTINKVTDVVTGKTVVSTLAYLNGEFLSTSKQLIEGGL